MTEEYSGINWSLGVRIDDPEDIAASDEQMRNVVITPLMEDMVNDLKKMFPVQS